MTTKKITVKQIEKPKCMATYGYGQPCKETPGFHSRLPVLMDVDGEVEITHYCYFHFHIRQMNDYIDLSEWDYDTRVVTQMQVREVEEWAGRSRSVNWENHHRQ